MPEINKTQNTGELQSPPWVAQKGELEARVQLLFEEVQNLQYQVRELRRAVRKQDE